MKKVFLKRILAAGAAVLIGVGIFGAVAVLEAPRAEAVGDCPGDETVADPDVCRVQDPDGVGCANGQVCCLNDANESHCVSVGGTVTIQPPSGAPTSISGAIDTVINFAFGIAGAVAVLVIIISGIRLITASGNRDVVDKAKTSLTWAIGGLIIVILAFVIVRLVIQALSG